MATPAKFNSVVEYLAEGIIDLDTHVLKIALTNTAPSASNTVLSDITEITAQNGYSTGGFEVTVSSSSQTSGVYRLILDDYVLTAVGGSIGPFRYAILYDDTPTSPANPLIWYVDYGSNLTLEVGDTLTFDFHDTNGVIVLQ